MRYEKKLNPLTLVLPALLLATSLACDVLSPPTPMPVCTPPPCGPDEVYYCPSGDCPGGCGTICVTPTGDLGSPTDTPPMPACTPPPCGPDEVYYCPDDCPGGCGTICVTPTGDPGSPTDTPPMPACTPPACGPDEVYYCPDDCPGGCGTICATPTPVPPTGSLGLAVGTYSETYAEGEHPTIHGTITLGDEPLVGASLSLEMFDEAGNLLWGTSIQSGDGGGFMVPLTYGDEIPTGYSGQLRVRATATYEGTQTRAEATFSYAPQQSESPPGCAQEAWGWFQGALELTPGLRDKIGCPTEAHRTLNAATQDFQRGYMVWRGDERLTYVIYEGTGWESYADRWQDGMPEQDPSYGPPPDGLIQPKRGFGLVWQENPAVRDGLGWALTEERACDQAHVQRFEHGLMLECTQDVVPRAKIRVFILFDDHTYDIYAPP